MAQIKIYRYRRLGIQKIIDIIIFQGMVIYKSGVDLL